MNYDLLLSAGHSLGDTSALFKGTSLSLDAWAFSPFGTLSQSAFLTSDDHWRTNVVRLDSTYAYSSQERLLTFRGGDVITGGLPWTRPIRMGGVQIQSNFSLRPDLVTAPVPSLSGTAAVPSTVDVFVDGIRMISQDVDAGPFNLLNVPLVAGNGDAQIVVRDAAGHVTKKTVPLYSSPDLLKPGLTSFSAEAGFARRGFGTTADTYVASPVGAATLRRGLFDWLTLEGHAEGGAGLVNGGVGLVAGAGRFGTISGAIAGSKDGTSSGVQAYVAFQTEFRGISISASALRTFGDYQGLASYTVPPSARTPSARALDRITIGAPLPFDPKSTVSASFLHSVDGASNTSNIVTASWSRAVSRSTSVYATAFSDFGNRHNYGAYIGLSTQFFDSISATTSVSSGPTGPSVYTFVSKPLAPGVGSLGWQFADGEGTAPYRRGQLEYRSPYALTRASVTQSPQNLRGSLEVEGSVVAMNGGVFLGNRIDGAFAVVNTGAPGVPVLIDNRPVGVTNPNGKMLVPGLRSYDRNQITIDPSGLPVDAAITTTRTVVSPADRSGVVVDFNVRTDAPSALVVFTRADGSFVPVGSSGRSDRGEEFIVGYDGDAFLTDLVHKNTVTINTPDGTCQGQFDYVPRKNEQVRIAPVLCVSTGSSQAGPPASRSR